LLPRALVRSLAGVTQQPRRLAEDTAPEIEALLVEHYRQLVPHQKVAIILDLNRTSEEAALAGIRERHPNADERELQLRLAALKYGRELMVKAYGWDPALEGW
jgi:hypothetical protein